MSLYTERMNRVRENLSEKGLAHTVISDLSSIYYLTGRMVYHVGERLLALYVPVQGRAVMYVNELFPIEPSDDFDIVYHKDGDVARIWPGICPAASWGWTSSGNASF